MEQRVARAYRLAWETDYMEFCDEKTNLEIHEFQDWRGTSSLMKSTPYNLPDPVVFYVNPVVLTYTDYPTNNVYWPVMSRRMYDVLCTVGNFLHRVIPVAMMDATQFAFEPKRQFLSNGQPNPGITDFNGFAAVQLLERSDYFDFEHSEYELHPRDPDWVRSVSKYVLNEPPEGFPPLFRLTVQSPELFISAEAREALKKSGIRGTAYYTLDDGYSLQDEVDIPVQLPTYS